MNLILFRHPEAIKNIHDEHGGLGSSLTNKGITQCSIFYNHYLANYGNAQDISFWGNSVPQVKETISRINKLGCDVYINDKLQGISLGVLSGLSRNEAMQKYPKAANLLELWRHGKINIDELFIPEGEKAMDFYFRIQEQWELINSHPSRLKVIVLTRSVYIMLLNLIKLGNQFSFSNYSVFNIPNASVSIIEGSKKNHKLLVENSIDYLNNYKSI
jgi:broad specificity phosphatase PhoE